MEREECSYLHSGLYSTTHHPSRPGPVSSGSPSLYQGSSSTCSITPPILSLHLPASLSWLVTVVLFCSCVVNLLS
ncbi:hypothetical protein F2Q68_00042704 [Brassica cretica]|uniref:Uncharacterized protein n=1 Tax=Brassica cretica TaxID=69181 RepID=A0A8S9MFI1_BRACR|nr:hypothetical protein F2Q68_00042704 [Brassica cretica]